MARTARSSANSTAVIRVYVTPEEKQQISDRAGDQSLSDYARRILLQKHSPAQVPAINRHLYMALGKPVRTLKQLLQACNQIIDKGKSDLLPADPAMLAELHQQMKEIRWLLLSPNVRQSEVEAEEAES